MPGRDQPIRNDLVALVGPAAQASLSALVLCGDFPAAPTFTPGTGLVGLKDRVEALGGQILLNSPAGAGTTLRMAVPLTASNPGAASQTRQDHADLVDNSALAVHGRDAEDPLLAVFA